MLSVLPALDVTAADFARWVSARGERVVPVAATTVDAALRAILVALPVAALSRAARRALATANGRSLEDIDGALAARSPREQTTWLAELAAGRPRLEAAAWLLGAVTDAGAWPDGDAVTDAAARLGLDRLVPALVSLTDPIAVLVVPTSPASTAALAPATAVAAWLCEALAPRAVALIAAPSVLDELGASDGDRGSVALARQGLIRLPAAGHHDVPAGGRSHAERALHAALNRDHRTCGRFALSYRLGIPFNGQDAEVDLYDAELAFAVEIDGWHHFREPDGYRRDRDKDLVLQRAGILVLRVLEQDVWDRLDYLVDYVAGALADRHRMRTASHSPHPR